MDFNVDGAEYVFTEAPLVFSERVFVDVFANLAAKTLGQTVNKPRYLRLAPRALANYQAFSNLPIGAFLHRLKLQNDDFYREFLNPHGDKAYCAFRLDDERIDHAKGIYLFAQDEEVVYVGRCQDSFANRINSGYGRISPKNCYLDGQATNCKINAHIASDARRVRFWCWVSEDDNLITKAEVDLIRHLSPRWNSQHVA